MKKRMISLVLSLAMLLSLAACSSTSSASSQTPSAAAASGSASPGSAPSGSSAGGDSQEPKNSDGSKLMAGVQLKVSSDTFKPYRYQDASGKWIGYDLSVLDALSEALGFTYNFSEIEFSGVVTSLQTGKSDLAPTLAETDERKKVLDFTEAYHIPKPLFAVQKTSAYSSVDDLTGKKIAVTFGTSWETMLKNKFSNSKITSMDTLSSVIADLKAGRQDAIFGDSVQISSYAKENDLKTIPWDIQYDIPPFHFGFKKGSSYVASFDKGLEYLKKTGKLHELQVKWLGEDSATDWSKVTE